MGKLIKAINQADHIIRGYRSSTLPLVVVEDALIEMGFYSLEYVDFDIIAAYKDGVRYSFDIPELTFIQRS